MTSRFTPAVVLMLAAGVAGCTPVRPSAEPGAASISNRNVLVQPAPTKAYTAPAAVAAALEQAGTNRAELETVLNRYAVSGDAQKLEAAEYLIAAMPGRGFDTLSFKDAAGVDLEFDTLKHPNFAAAQAAFGELEKSRGDAQMYRRSSWPDLTTLSADLLTVHIDAAFAAWRSKPWAKTVEFDTFKRYILPYRGSEEPVEDWRTPLAARFAGVESELTDPTDGRAAAAIIRKGVDSIIGFSELYYLHPTDQSYSQMAAAKLGRCEDITNMCLYAWRASAIPCAMDYTPFWANRDNNHAWEVVLVGELDTSVIKGSAKAAKVYRKEFALQPESLGARLRADEPAPRGLRSRTIRDVTDQYIPVSDIALDLSGKPEASRFAYLCVFNGGQWQPVAFGPADASGRATFGKVGRDVVYLPAWYSGDKLVPAGPPLVLEKDGTLAALGTLGSPGTGTTDLELAVLRPQVSDPDTRRDKPSVRAEPGKTYELLAWEAGDWKPLGQVQALEGTPLWFPAVPEGRLLWMRAQGGDRLERVFTIDAGKVRWW